MAKYYAIPDKIEKQIEEMIKIDSTMIEQQIESNIVNESFINNLIYQVNDLIINYETTLAGKLREYRLKYITGSSDERDISDIRLNRNEMDQIINGSREIQVLNQKINELQNMLKFYDRTLMTIRNKNYALKNIIDYRKFMAGGN